MEECSFDVLFEVEVAPIPSGVLIGDVAEHVDVHAAGFGGAGGQAPAEFTTKGEARVEEFGGGFPYVGVGGIDGFQLLRGEATCAFGAATLKDACVEVAVAGVFEEAVFDAVVGVAFVEDGIVEEFQFFGRQRVLWLLERCHQQAQTPGAEVDLVVGGRARNDAVEVFWITLRRHQALASTC